MKSKSSVYSQKFSSSSFNKNNNTYSYILNQIKPTDKYIFDVGCSSGFIGKQIKKKFPKTIVYGADNNLEDLKKASKALDKTFQIDLNYFDPKEIKQKFDYIIIADVVEHLTNPNKLLSSLPILLKPNGKVLLSIPNFSHYTVINRLLTHKWKYDNFGLLDKTHVHFYTYKTICELIKANKFTINQTDMNLSLPTYSTQIQEMSQNKLPLIYSLYTKIYNPENMIFQYLITFSTNNQTNSKIITSALPIMNICQFYFNSLIQLIKNIFK